MVEVWAKEYSDMRLIVCVNRTPVTGDIRVARDKREINFFGCGLAHTVAQASTDKRFAIRLNIITPHMPITSDGKEPDLVPFLGQIRDAVSKAVKKAQTPKVSQDGLLPKRKRGRQSDDGTIEYEDKLAEFCKLILQIRPTMDFSVGSRGWCYILERHGLRKGEFDAAEKLITECRKSGALPLDICAEDESRKTIGVQEISDLGIEEQAEKWISHILNEVHKTYTPVSFWDDQKYYVEMATEKLDLRNLFEPVCNEFFVPIQNFKGWSDVNGRAIMMQRFKYWESRGKICVLLLCGDHDPGGLHITNKMRKNLEDISGAVGWTPDNLIIIRFGLNAEFIEDNDLTWIDNLETSSGKQLDDPNHKDHDQEYVQGYIEQFGVKKCEANALVVEPEIGRQLCREAILQYVSEDAPARYRRKLSREQAKLRKAIRQRMG